MSGTGEDVTLTFANATTAAADRESFLSRPDPNFLHRGLARDLGYALRREAADRPLRCCRPSCRPSTGILLSHMHGDHWDRIVTKSLPKGNPPVVTTPEAGGSRLADRGVSPRTLDLAPVADPRVHPGDDDRAGDPRCPASTGPGRLPACCRRSWVASLSSSATGELGWARVTSPETPSTGGSWARCSSGAVPSTSLIPISAGPGHSGANGDDGRPAGCRPGRVAEPPRAGALRRTNSASEHCSATSSPRFLLVLPGELRSAERGDTISRAR